MSDDKQGKNEQARDMRRLMQTVRRVDVNDPKKKKNKDQMRDANGRVLRFNEG